MIGGTSTGSIIATGLALGWSVEKLETLYHELAEQVFQKSILAEGNLAGKISLDSTDESADGAI